MTKQSLTDKQAVEAYDRACAIPLSDEEIGKIVRYAVDGAQLQAMKRALVYVYALLTEMGLAANNFSGTIKQNLNSLADEINKLDTR